MTLSVAETQDRAKDAAAEGALSEVRDGMVLGLGSGSTAERFVVKLGALIARTGLSIRGVPTSDDTARLAADVGVPLLAPDAVERIDLAVDGADEIDPDLGLIKGGGGKHLREKIIAAAADRFVVIADESKLVERLGAFPLPVEIDRFAAPLAVRATGRALAASGARDDAIALRRLPNGSSFLTDGGNFIIDCAAGPLADPSALAARLAVIPGVLAHGLFLGMADLAIVAGPNGARRLTPR